MRRINRAGLDLIKKWEQCRLKAYRDGGGVLTIGWGHTGESVKETSVITQHQADEILKFDVSTFEEFVDHLAPIWLNENQFSALVVFTFNVGPPRFAGSTLLKRLHEGKIAAAADEFQRWNKDQNPKTGKLEVVAGLTNRRMAERDLFLKPVGDKDVC